MINQMLVNRYEIQQQLAKKSGRRTLLARDIETQELVVVKLLVFGNDFEWDDLKLFEREAEILKNLSHPAIPRYLDYFELDSQNFKGFALVQTYIPAKSLEEHIKAGITFSEDEVKQLAVALLEILIYLHKRQPPVIHRDLKPSNILLTNPEDSSSCQVYVVDFGSVQTIAAREGGTMTVVGTYGYMPPEQFGDRATPASDLYSLGATLITLITGTHPADLPHKDGRIQFEQVACVSAAFSRWLSQLTEPSLDRRLASAVQALQALNQPAPINHALSASKPFGSKIELQKTADALEIILPPRGFSADIVGLTLFAIAWNSFIVMWTASTVFTVPSSGINLFFALFSLPFWGAGISMVWQIIATLFRRVRLVINHKHISRTYEVFGWRYSYRRPAPIAEINKLEIEYSSNGRSKIIIWAGTQKYEIGDLTYAHDPAWMDKSSRGKQKHRLSNYSAITEPELEWLAHELSDRLELPILVKQLPEARARG